MRNIEVEKGQTLYDIALQYYGSVEAVIFILADNPSVSLDDELSEKQKIIIRQNSDQPKVVAWYNQEKIKPNSGTYHP